MSSLNIVLVEPRIPQNTGNIARTCAATGCALHLVRPMAFDVDDAKLKRAGLDYWHLLNITHHNSLDAFLASVDGDCFFYSTKAQRTHSEITYPDNPYLVFGREDAGLPEELLLSHPEQCVRIPIIPQARSLNLSNAAAIAAYEVLRQWNYPQLSANGQLTRYRWPTPHV